MFTKQLWEIGVDSCNMNSIQLHYVQLAIISDNEMTFLLEKQAIIFH